MKILYLHDYPFRVEPNGGIGFEVGMPISYFDRFINNGFSVDILSRINSTLDGNFIKKEDIKISKFSSRSYFVVFFKMFSLFFKKGKYDLVVVNYPSIIGLFFLFFFSNKYKYILEHVNDDHSFESKFGGKFICYLLKRMKRKFFTNAYGVTSVANYLVNDYYPEKYIVASNVNVCIPEEIIRNNFDPLKIISVGALSKKKGIDLAIERIKELDIQCEYYIAGGIGDLDFNKLISNLPTNLKIIHLGMIDKKELYEYLSNSHIFIQPSRSEGLPRALIEGMAYSLPAIVSTLPCFSDLIKDKFMIDWEQSGSLNNAVNYLFHGDNYSIEAIDNYKISLAFDCLILSNKKNKFYKDIYHELYGCRKS